MNNSQRNQQGDRSARSDKPAVPLEEMVDRARAARGEAAGEQTLSSAAKAPSPTPDAPPGPPGDETTSTADLLDDDQPEGADPSRQADGGKRPR